MNTDTVRSLFEREFGQLAEKFTIFGVSVDQAKESRESELCHPGVYVWWHPDRGVIKVGRHLTNSRKRALEHLRDNTGGIMAALEGDKATRLLLFNVKNPADHHWVAALEIFFESKLHPAVASDRLG
ncbi:MAG: hypothetical protein ACYDCJ_13755 [Gammaproteobacteria bacterium]